MMDGLIQAVLKYLDNYNPFPYINFFGMIGQVL
jgi:hypothetical protein